MTRARAIGKQVGLGSLGVAVVTAVCFPLHPELSIPGMLYLLILVFQSLFAEFVSVAIVSLVAVACLEYYFIPPILEWQINDPEDGVALVTYLVTCLVVTRLATRARVQTLAAEQKRRDVTHLYDAASRLLSTAPDADAGQPLRIFRDILGLRAACFFDSASQTLLVDGDSACNLAEKCRDACIARKDYQDADSQVYLRCLYRGEAITGAAGFEGLLDESLVPALAVLAATALERMQTFRTASKAAANAEAEILRSAILDAFAHEFKTPLAIILAAAGSLHEIAEGRPEQMELTEFIENQTVRLNQLTTRLLRIAKLDRDEVRPAMERLRLDAFLRRIIEYGQSQFGRLIPLTPSNVTAEIAADAELLGLAVTQLLDNACKYSTPGTPVTLTIAIAGDMVEIRVTNQGSSIRPEERERIFERFVRGAGREHLAPGTGLGLYVARKIIRAHGGDLEFDRATSTASATTFRIQLPVSRPPASAISLERSHEQEVPQSTGR